MGINAIQMARAVELWPLDKLKPYANNARTHSAEQILKIAASITEFGFTNPILVDGSAGIIAGHGRLLAAQQLGMAEVPVIELTHLSEAQKRAYIIADNRLALDAGWDEDMLAYELDALRDMEYDLALTGFTDKELADLIGSPDDPYDGSGSDDAHANLAEKFGAPPFTVLDTRQGYWQERRDKWLAITGNLTETKENVLGDSMLAEINEGSSNFDPVLAELMMRWFCPPGGKMLDPFGGEQTKGVVAGMLGLRYRAVEFRADQVAVNNAACARFGDAVQYTCGDSENIDHLLADRDFDFCFTSPPYYDLEVYSKEDMSALGTYEEFMAKYERIFAKCVAMMGQNGFLVIKIGEIRDKKTGEYRNFLGDNIAMFKRLGLHYYNEIALINSFGTAPQRANKMFGSRKMVKVHQNVLVFWKGNLNVIKAKFEGITDGADLSE